MKKIIFCFLFLLISFMVVSVETVSAQETCDKSTVEVVFRDSQGNFIPDINFSIHVQVDDADGQAKPGSKVASGKVSNITGIGTVSFTSKYTNFVIKAWDQNANVGEFYFYDDLTVCGDTVRVTEDLSAIKFVFRDTDNELIRNQAFSIYTQRYDADGKPIKEKQDLVAKLNTSEEGEKTIYVPDSFRSIDGRGTDYYIMETEGTDSGIYRKFDILVNEGDTTTVDYVFSDVVFNVKDKQGVAFPAGEKLSVYKQIVNDKGDDDFGDLVKTIYTDDNGVANLQYPAGTYIVRLIGENNKNFDFFNIEISENERSEYPLSPDGDWSPGQGACELQSSFTINTRDMDGEVLSGVKYELYEQELDINGVPKATIKKLEGEVDALGTAVGLFNPDPRKKYALKLYLHNPTVGEFWYFNEIQFSCGSDLTLVKHLPALKVVLRNGDNSLVKNKKFSLYTQKFDVDGFPVREKKDLVSSDFTTSVDGQAEIYISSDHLFDKDKRGTYVLEVIGENNEKYTEYGIKTKADKNTNLEYIFSDIVVDLKQANGQVLVGKEITAYSRSLDAKGEYVLGSKQQTVETDENGKARFPLPVGFYVLRIKDSLGNNINFWNIRVSDRKRNTKSLTINTTKVSTYDGGANANVPNKAFTVYSLKENNEGTYERYKKIKAMKTGAGAYKDLILASNPYLFVATKDKQEYGVAIYASDKKFQEPVINFSNTGLITQDQKYSLERPAREMPMFKKLAGRILLQVESLGEAWYVDTNSYKRYYMKDGLAAYEMMRKFGLGISNADLKKIPIGLDDRFEEFDYDGDSVPDKMEEAIGTDMYNQDSDGDGFEDGEEIKNGFDPLGKGSLHLNQGLADKLKGKILLQVESKGEAWYINPENGKRYYMKDGDSAYEIMRFLSLGITNDNLEEIEVGSLAQ